MKLKKYPALPHSVRLMNTNTQLPFCIEILPECFSHAAGLMGEPLLHISNIPVDDLAQEPIVLEIEWA